MLVWETCKSKRPEVGEELLSQVKTTMQLLQTSWLAAVHHSALIESLYIDDLKRFYKEMDRLREAGTDSDSQDEAGTDESRPNFSLV